MGIPDRVGILAGSKYIRGGRYTRGWVYIPLGHGTWVRLATGRYASYWNAFLLNGIFNKTSSVAKIINCITDDKICLYITVDLFCVNLFICRLSKVGVETAYNYCWKSGLK